MISPNERWSLTLRQVWDAQTPSDDLLAVLDVAARAAHEFLLKPQEGSNPAASA